jgi:Mg/Co/Ni transporter MgtE
MQVKERNSWEILRNHLTDDSSTGLNEYLSALSGEESLRALMRLEADEQQQILARLTPESAADVIEARQLMAYDDDVAGGLMMKEYFSYPKMYRASSVLSDLAGREADYELNHVLYIYVTGQVGELLGGTGSLDMARQWLARSRGWPGTGRQYDTGGFDRWYRAGHS